MKIEKVNEHQIRCTLTREDLADRELKISELAYGTEKAKNLFRDMMQQAACECGFEAEDIPLMIEAIPLNAECIVLIITKVEDPEELDTRFSKFAPSVHHEDMDDSEDIMEAFADSADEMLDMLRKMDQQSRSAASGAGKKSAVPTGETVSAPHAPRIFSFASLYDVMRSAHIAVPLCHGENSLYKKDTDGSYLLLVNPADSAAADFNRLCNTLSEYGSQERFSSAVESYLEEHCETVIRDKAIQSLASI
ncbi:MAG: adaptor protein MecA [Blautia sp.]|nr:adaptor protein MecA [Blautia sp.]MCM1202373.1 adaptor protein MecA [Bacteroides fragilis]